MMLAAALLLAFLQTDPFLAWMDRAAQRQLDARDTRAAALRTAADARARQTEIRETILRLIGGLPQTRSPLNPRITGTLRRKGFRIEKLWFESLPGYRVTANLYLPGAPGPHPAILYSMGHWLEGKAQAQSIASNLALKGFVVLVYDPVGQGERLQAWSPLTGLSLAGGTTDQHFQDGARSFLLGESVARYFIWDGMRAIDYLVSRPEVDRNRIGATGCSGGGTQTTYIMALDERVKAAAPACYITSFHELYSGAIGDSEQSVHGFLSSGLDQADWLALFAPRALLIASTENDFFPIAGARRAFNAARAFHRLFDAEPRVAHVVGPGGHGTPLEVRERIYGWFIEHLKDGKGDAKEIAVDLLPDFELNVTASPAVPAAAGGLELREIIAQRLPRASSGGDVRAEIRRWLREPEGLEPWPTAISYHAGSGSPLLVVQTSKEDEALAQAAIAKGHAVLTVRPRGTPMPARSGAYSLAGDWLATTRAALIGHSLTGWRVLDILRGVDSLAARGHKNIRACARSSAGVWLLLAAAADPRIEAVWVHETPVSLREAIRAPLHQHLHEISLPGFAARFDLDDVRAAIAPREVLWTDPVNPMRRVAKCPGNYKYRVNSQPESDFLTTFLR
jgi:hypothetical protein